MAGKGKMVFKKRVVGAKFSAKEKKWYVTINGDKFSKAAFPSKEAAIEGYREYVIVMEREFPRVVK